MNLDDPELLETPRVIDSRLPSGYRYKSMDCKEDKHKDCIITSCECQCHAHDTERHRLHTALVGGTRCTSTGCDNRAYGSAIFCYQCARGNTPSKRALQ